MGALSPLKTCKGSLKFVIWWSSIIAALTVDSASSAKVTVSKNVNDDLPCTQVKSTATSFPHESDTVCRSRFGRRSFLIVQRSRLIS